MAPKFSLSHACRAAFGELFAGQAGQLAERMGRLRQKEAAKREGFLKHAEVRQGTVPSNACFEALFLAASDINRLCILALGYRRCWIQYLKGISLWGQHIFMQLGHIRHCKLHASPA